MDSMTEPAPRATQHDVARCGRADVALARGLHRARQALDRRRAREPPLGPAGFRELSRAIDGVSDSVLSDRLAELTASGLVARTV